MPTFDADTLRELRDFRSRKYTPTTSRGGRDLGVVEGDDVS